MGIFTIVGSAAYNLLIITAICIISVPSPEVKKIREIGVFLVTAFWSLFAYIWLLITLLWVSTYVIHVCYEFIDLNNQFLLWNITPGRETNNYILINLRYYKQFHNFELQPF